MRPRRDDEAQLLLLAGIVLTIAFILTALTLTQVAALEKEAAQQVGSPIISEWRFLHDRLASNVRTAVTGETTNQSFNDTVLPTLSATFRALAAEKGYDFALRKASDGNFTWNGNEASLVSGASYNAWSDDGATHFTQVKDDQITDGILWQKPCPVDGPTAGCIGGIYIFVRLADGTTSLEESVLFAVNQG